MAPASCLLASGEGLPCLWGILLVLLLAVVSDLKTCRNFIILTICTLEGVYTVLLWSPDSRSVIANHFQSASIMWTDCRMFFYPGLLFTHFVWEVICVVCGYLERSKKVGAVWVDATLWGCAQTKSVDAHDTLQWCISGKGIESEGMQSCILKCITLQAGPLTPLFTRMYQRHSWIISCTALKNPSKWPCKFIQWSFHKCFAIVCQFAG